MSFGPVLGASLSKKREWTWTLLLSQGPEALVVILYTSRRDLCLEPMLCYYLIHANHDREPLLKPSNVLVMKHLIKGACPTFSFLVPILKE